jgi:hypothetical protein
MSYQKAGEKGLCLRAVFYASAFCRISLLELKYRFCRWKWQGKIKEYRTAIISAAVTGR